MSVYSIRRGSYDGCHMKRLPTLVTTGVLAFLAACLVPASSAMALDTVNKLKADNTYWLTLVVAVLLGLVVGMGSFKSSKRTHLD